MDRLPNTQRTDRWWIVALCAAIIGTILVILLWNFPTSKWVWLLASFTLLFVAVLYLNPRFRYWHRANWCFGIAGVLAFVPSFIAKAQLEGSGAFEFASDASPLIVLGFLAAGLVLSWLDSRQHETSAAEVECDTAITSNPVNSPNSVTGLTAGGSIVINNGMSEDTLLKLIDAQQVASRVHASTNLEPRDVDEELVWQLVDDIRDARRRFEHESALRLLNTLQASFERSGGQWSKVLRTEALLLMAEEERAKIARSRLDGHQIDLVRLHELLKELRDV